MTETDLSRLFSFAVASHEGDENGESLASRKQRTGRDPMSHRIIEKRRRDRMNNCLADLSQLIPSTFIKQGQGRIEKTEIIEMAIRHIKFLQSNGNSVSGEDHPSSNEMFLKGYQECRADTFSIFEEVGFGATEPVLLHLKNHLHAKISHLQEELKSFLQPDHMESFPPTNNPTNTCHQWSCVSGAGGGSSTTGSGTGSSNCLQADGRGDSGMGSSTKAGQGSSETSSGGCKSSSSSSQSRGGEEDLKPQAYKFKQDIQQRFISHVGGAMDKHQPSPADMMTASVAAAVVGTMTGDNNHNPINKNIMPMAEDTKEDYKDPQPQLKRVENSPSSVCQDNSSGSAYGSTSSVHTFKSTESSSKSMNSTSSEDQDISLNNTVPAFALHPMGFFYIPVVLPISQVMPFMSGHKSMGICHPVSIPVSFTGPFPIGSQEGDKGQAMATAAAMPTFGAHQLPVRHHSSRSTRKTATSSEDSRKSL